MPAMFGSNILNEAFEFTDGGERNSFICLVAQVYPYFATVLYFPMMTSYSTFPLKSHFFSTYTGIEQSWEFYSIFRVPM